VITLYELAGADPDHRFSPYCWRTRMALAHKGIEARTVPWRFGEKRKLPGSAKTPRVPVIVEDGTTVADSTAIAYYLEERHPEGPSLFNGEGGEAHARFIIAWADTVLVPGIFPMVAAEAVRWMRPEDMPYFRESREARLGCTLEQAAADAKRLPNFRDGLAPLRAALASHAYLGGEEPSYADHAVFGCFQWARLISAVELLAEDDPLNAWRDRMLDLFGGIARDAKSWRELGAHAAA
jgi:glutathione S-transferase